ncbi:MAG: phosphomannomutase/phosphoglucomutase [Planctomycetes bacterium]|nr:phosphomannomutase/phosphoglucomutase [Planctomycetota bacterium]
MAGIFKAYDIRGTYPDQLDEAMARKIGRAFGALIGAGPIAVGRDMRSHSPGLQRQVMEGVADAGLDVVDIGLCSTPALYFATGRYGYRGGAQVTASHNPARYNGMKLCRHEAIPISSESGIAEIERMATSGKFPKASRRGAIQARDITADYHAHILSFLAPAKVPLALAADFGNGMGATYAPVLERLGCARVIKLYETLDGTFPNHEANPLDPATMVDLQVAVRNAGCDLGVAFDGDADRSAYVDETGALAPCDLMTAFIAVEVLARDPGARIVYDLRSSRAVPEVIREHGGVPVRERVGHSFMKATMREGNCAFGGEVSGHFYFRENFFADSGAIALVKVLNLVRASGKRLSALIAPLRRYEKPPEVSFHVADKEEALQRLKETFADGKQDFLDGVTEEYDDWWFNVRPSNTEPVLRLNIEATTAGLLRDRRDAVARAISG